MEPHVRFPVTAGNEPPPYFSTFNFVHFHNQRQTGEGAAADARDDFRLLAVRQFDRFHHPLCLLVAVNPGDGRVTLTAHYDPERFTASQVADLLAEYAQGLEQIV